MQLSSLTQVNTSTARASVRDGVVDAVDRAVDRMVEARLDELRAATRDDGCAIHEESVRDFRRFLQVAPGGLTQPQLSLVDDGDVRAFWRDGDRRLGVQFLGDGKVEYVLLDDPPVVRRVRIADFWIVDGLASLMTS